MTAWTNWREASSTTATSSASFEPKWAKSPLLDRPVASARRPIDRPVTPTTFASSNARSRIACRVSSPLLT